MPDQPFVTSIDIINLSHSLKDICEVNCKTPECFSYTLKMLLQYNLIKLNLIFSQQLDCQMPPLCGRMDGSNQPGLRTSPKGGQQESEVIEDLGILDLEAISSPVRLGSEGLGLEELALLDHADSQKQK